MKNKGFTLVELLGILVIMIAITLVAVPIVYTNIKNVRLQTAKSNTDKLIKTAVDYYETNVMKNEKFTGITIECDGTKCFDEDNPSKELSFSGAKPKGHITISQYDEVLQADLLFDRYVCSYIDDSIECKKPDLVIDNITDFNTFLSKANEYDNKVVVLSSDLDYNNKTFTPTSKTFKGEFNALGYSISNINYEGAYHGIFHTIDGATIKSLKVEKSVFTINANTNDIGVIAGIAQNNSKIYNCYSIDNTIKASSSSIASQNIGGLIGKISASYISGCSSKRVVINGSGNSSDSKHGGIIGSTTDTSTINNCFILDSYISGYDNISGITGNLTGNVYNSYSKNVLLNGSNTQISGLVSISWGISTINNSYVSYDSSNDDIINRIKTSNAVGGAIIPTDLIGNINASGPIAAGIVGYRGNDASLTLNNVYVKNVILSSNNKSTAGYLIGNIGSGGSTVFNNTYALSKDNSYQGQIAKTAIIKNNTIIFNYDDAIAYKSSDINLISDWKNNLDKNWNTTSSKYPMLYKIDKNGNPTSYLLGGQE